MGSAAGFLLGCLLDAALGDPRMMPHPVRWMGRAAAALEGALRRPGQSPRAALAAGALLVLLVTGGAGAAAWLAVELAGRAGPAARVAAEGLLLWSSVAARGLAEAGMAVYRPLARGDLEAARQALGLVVSRDTAALGEADLARGAVETVAENTVDAVLAPLFYFVLGGAPLALVYRAANTLDAMFGYRNERYLYFGRAAARLDDALNFLPARLGGLLLAAAAALLGLDAAGAGRAVRRYARLHPSPNSGVPEAAVAGALGIRLGGWNSYHGAPVFRAYLGEPRRELAAGHIRQAVRLMLCAGVLAAAGGAAALWAAHGGRWY